jgi:hypothetical protein
VNFAPGVGIGVDDMEAKGWSARRKGGVGTGAAENDGIGDICADAMMPPSNRETSMNDVTSLM